MQLFVCSYNLQGDNLIVDDERVCEHTRKVLRYKSGDVFCVQKFDIDNIKRYKVEIIGYDKGLINTKILEKLTLDYNNFDGGICVALLNKFSKIELIVQKLTEIGIPNIVFFKSQRSQIKDISENKLKRLEKIKIHAIEQSKSIINTQIKFVKDISDYLKDKNIVFFDSSGDKSLGDNKFSFNIYGLIGPEGGFTKNDYEKFNQKYKTIKLTDNILRSETAALLGGYILKN